MPSVATRINQRLTDNADRASLSSVVRRGRWQQLLDAFPDLADMRVIDIGGTASSWELSPVRPASLTLVNLPRTFHRDPDDGIERIAADACEPLALSGFDLAFCNSVIEHVGGHQRRVALADNIQRIASHYWVQTPYRYFPIEQHALCPLIHWLPVKARAFAMRYWPIGHMRIATDGFPAPERAVRGWSGTPLRHAPPEYAVRIALSVELLSTTELRFLFPGARIVRERVAGLPKSIIAVA